MPSQGRKIKTDVLIHSHQDNEDGRVSFRERDARYSSIRVASFAARQPLRSAGEKLGAKITLLTRRSSSACDLVFDEL